MNELAERVVSKESEIDVISKALDELAEGLESKGKGLSARQDEIEELQTTVAGVLEQNKGRKISEAQTALRELDGEIEDLGVKKEEAQKRLAEYQELIAKAQANKDLSADEL